MNVTRALRVHFCALLLLTGCAGEDPLAPPEIRLGRDECVECGMLIMEDRCSAARVVEVQGRREAEKFDDIGCLLDLERERGSGEVLERYFRDHETGAWVPLPEASFLLAESIRTPMGTGIVAFSGRQRAGQKQAETGGQVLEYPALAEARARAVQERRERSER